MFHIRQADNIDMQALEALYQAMGYVADREYFKKCFKDQIAGGRVLYVMEEEGDSVAGAGAGQEGLSGFCILNWRPRYKLFKTLGIPEIQDLCIIPACRGQGRGSALIDHCEERAARKGYKQMGIGVGLTRSFGAAQRLYVTKGYVPDGYGVVHDREYVQEGQMKPVDSELNIMMIKSL